VSASAAHRGPADTAEEPASVAQQSGPMRPISATVCQARRPS
jgi:hypothetical protein